MEIKKERETENIIIIIEFTQKKSLRLSLLNFIVNTTI